MTVGVRFHTPVLRYFRYGGEAPPPGSFVVVEGPQGQALGQVRTPPKEARPEGRILRLASREDLDRAARLRARAQEALFYLRARTREEGLEVRVLLCEYTLDGHRLLVHYAAEGKVNLRPLGAELARLFGARVEFLLEGPREEARTVGVLGACGMEACCTFWLQGFAPVGIRMARDQGLPLSPEKISGPCGRLLCCLAYEHPMYEELLAELPKRGSRVCTKAGLCGKVQKLNPLRGSVEVQLEEGKVVEVPKEELL